LILFGARSRAGFDVIVLPATEVVSAKPEPVIPTIPLFLFSKRLLDLCQTRVAYWPLPPYRREGPVVKCPKCWMRVSAWMVQKGDVSSWCDVVPEGSVHCLVCPHCEKLSLLGETKLRQDWSPVILREIEIPAEIHERMRGCYKMAKLRTIWFVSTCFEHGHLYTADGVGRVIDRALYRMDQSGGCCGASELRAALRELKFLEPVDDGRRYRKISG
jgi:hypothetical protein